MPTWPHATTTRLTLLTTRISNCIVHVSILPPQIKALAGDAMDPRCFGFIEPPPPDSLEAACISLKQVGLLRIYRDLVNHSFS